MNCMNTLQGLLMHKTNSELQQLSTHLAKHFQKLYQENINIKPHAKPNTLSKISLYGGHFNKWDEMPRKRRNSEHSNWQRSYFHVKLFTIFRFI